MTMRFPECDGRRTYIPISIGGLKTWDMSQGSKSDGYVTFSMYSVAQPKSLSD